MWDAEFYPETAHLLPYRSTLRHTTKQGQFISKLKSSSLAMKGKDKMHIDNQGEVQSV
jgi:hypothetical protein